jgi:DNA modification methylase
MGQQFKSIYLNDEKVDSNQKNVTLAFGVRDADIFSAIKDLSSVEVRDILGSPTYSVLEKRAFSNGYSFNSYCLKLLRKAVEKESLPNQIQLIDPVHTTFRGGIGDPLHEWYPYLEGYSPDFVTAILDKYMTSAKSIYDPFSGSGTTPIATALRGLDSYYSEVNPVLQTISEAKMSARNLTSAQRREIVGNLLKVADELDSLIEDMPEDEPLTVAYIQCFGSSKFFDDTTYKQITKTRTLIDTLSSNSPETSRFVLVAVLRALVPSSLLQRAGDLRYKTPKELATKKVDFINEAKSNLRMIADDLLKVNNISIKPVFVTENAKNIDKITDLHIDGVITSPPYLNGTNYFRNTKLELWFIRGITEAKHLTAYRAKAVTAGINDVTTRRDLEHLSDSLQALVSKLEKEAYDQRIPKMVHYYFIDMLKIFRGLKKHLNPDSTVAIDIGDSVYSDVHVPTDVILEELLVQEGYELIETSVLRKRTSRSGQTLRQVLLVFKYSPKSTATRDRAQKLAYWEDFKINQQHQQLPYSKRNWGHPLHSLCSYQGKMKPSLAHHLIKSFCKPGDKMLDPFVGVGTIPFEAALNGVESYGFDISPAALIIAQAKVGSINPGECTKAMDELEKWLKVDHFTENELLLASEFGYNRKLKEYYHEQTLKEILSARNFFKQKIILNDSEALVMACLLHILHGNRPYALSRRSHPITPFAPTGDYEYRALMPRLRAKVSKSLSELPADSYKRGKMFFQDITAPWPAEVDDLDTIITSPPFFDSTRFHSANWLRLWFAGWNNDDFKLRPRIFIDEKQKKSFDVYEPIFRQSRERLKQGGLLVLHLGKSKKSDMAYELTRKAKPWFKVTDIFSENVEHTESHGIRDKGTVVEHQYLILS